MKANFKSLEGKVKIVPDPYITYEEALVVHTSHKDFVEQEVVSWLNLRSFGQVQGHLQNKCQICVAFISF